METNAGTGWPQIMMLIGSIFLFLLYRSKYRCQHRLNSSCGGLCYGCCLPTVWKKEGQRSTGISAFNCRCSMKNCIRFLDCFSNKALHYYMQFIWSLRLNKLSCIESRVPFIHLTKHNVTRSSNFEILPKCALHPVNWRSEEHTSELQSPK